MRVQIVDPSAFTPPYDHALAGALARAGVAVELVTSRFVYGPVPRAEGFAVSERFYRLATRPGRAREVRPAGPARRALKLLEHVPDMLRYRRLAAQADVVHYQWLTVPQLDAFLLPRARPRVLTAHDVLPREPRPGQLAAVRRVMHEMDAVVVHSEHGAARLREAIDIEARVIPHGAFDHLTRQPDERPLPPELAAVEGPVVLCFGLMRPYKGIDVLIEGFRSIANVELWVVGMPRMPIEPLRELARGAPGTVRFVPRFITDPEIPAYFRRADLVVLPYREIDQSGVLYTALAFGKPLVLTSVGGFTEIAERHDAARLVPPGDPDALGGAIAGLVADEAARSSLARAAERAAREHYSWDEAARRTLALYRELLAARSGVG